MDSVVGAIGIHVSAAPDGMPKSPILPAAGCQLGRPAPRLKVKEPDGLHLRAPCMLVKEMLCVHEAMLCRLFFFYLLNVLWMYPKSAYKQC